jgi:hypothetical protein
MAGGELAHGPAIDTRLMGEGSKAGRGWPRRTVDIGAREGLAGGIPMRNRFVIRAQGVWGETGGHPSGHIRVDNPHGSRGRRRAQAWPRRDVGSAGFALFR